MATVQTLKTDLEQVINDNTGDQQALENAVDEIGDHLFDNCDKDDLDIIYAQIGVMCRRHDDE